MEFNIIESLRLMNVYATTGYAQGSSKIISVWRSPFKLEIEASDYQMSLTEFPEIDEKLVLSRDWALYEDKDCKVSTNMENTYILSFLGYDLVAFSFNSYDNKNVEIKVLPAITDRKII